MTIISAAIFLNNLDYSRAKATPPHPCIKRMDEEAACEGVVNYLEQAAMKSML
jgi:hypothetical protein